MPTYAYACADCGHAFDVVQSFSDDSLTVCPECEGRLRKQFSAVGVVFKGSGFYRTDSRAGGSGKSASSSVPAKSGSGASGESNASGGSAGRSGSGSGDSGSSGSGSGGSGSGGSGESGSASGSSSTGSGAKVSASSTGG
ncbi:MAG: FmdB family zinc ribbon protein [Tetrasphaera sp.]